MISVVSYVMRRRSANQTHSSSSTNTAVADESAHSNYTRIRDASLRKSFFFLSISFFVQTILNISSSMFHTYMIQRFLFIREWRKIYIIYTYLKIDKMIMNVDVYPLVFVLTIICTSFYISMCTDILFIALV